RALDLLDVRSVRHDEHRLPIEGRQVAVEQALDLTRVGGPHDEAQRHCTIVEPPPDDSGGALPAELPRLRTRTWACGRAVPPAAPASSRRSRRRGPPAWRPVAHRNT